MAAGNPLQVGGSGLLVILLIAVQGAARLHSARRMLRRLRWFFVSLLVLYFWFTPGEPVFSVDAQWSGWLPTREGVAEGGIRIAALIVIVLAVNVLVIATSREQLLTGLLWLASPLESLGANRERFALRITLVLGAAPRVQELLTQVRQGSAGTGVRGIASIGATAGRAFEMTLHEADNASLAPVVVQFGSAPPTWQWSCPALLVAGWFAAM